jgi:GT2 family glycosyltransferase
MSSPDYRIIIPCFNARISLARQLADMRRKGDVAFSKIIVVDDGSLDGTSEWLAATYPEVKVLQGNGSLFWAGGIRLGMDYAMTTQATVIVWLNHDCRPDHGAVAKVVEATAAPEMGAVSGWCYTDGFPNYPFNPGFRSGKPLDVRELCRYDFVPADGLNGNFVALSVDAVRKIGLPDTYRHPHYGDGPYTFKLRNQGFKVGVRPQARAALDRDLERRVSTFWQVAIWRRTLFWQLRFFFTDVRSLRYWRHRWFSALLYRGPVFGAISFALGQISLFFIILAARSAAFLCRPDHLIERAVLAYRHCEPEEKLRADLQKLRR